MDREAWIIDAVRSPRGKGKETGALHPVHPQRILAQVLNALQERNGFDTAEVDDVVMGCGAGSGDHAMDIARMAALDAGWSLDAPGVTLNRFCGSGQQAVNFARHGRARPASRTSSSAAASSRCRGPAPLHVDGFTANNHHLCDQYHMVAQGISADLIATVEGFSREECDQLAVDSQDRAPGRHRRGPLRPQRSCRSSTTTARLALDHEEFPRPGTTLADLAKLPPELRQDGRRTPCAGQELTIDQTALLAYPQLDEIRHVHHAGNSSGVVDGASAVLVASPDYAKAHGLTPRARIMMTAVAGTEPVIMLTAPGPAATRCVEKAGMTFDDIDLFEVNEAFAAVVLKFLRDTGVDWDKVQRQRRRDGARPPDRRHRRDAHRHPARRARAPATCSTGLVTMCTGGGMGTATIIERL